MSVCETTVMQNYVTWNASPSPHLAHHQSGSTKNAKHHPQQLPFISPSASTSSSPNDTSNNNPLGTYLVLIGWKTVCYAGVAIKMVIMVVLVSILWVILFIPQIEHYVRLAFAYLFPKSTSTKKRKGQGDASKLCEIITDKQHHFDQDGDMVMLDLLQRGRSSVKSDFSALIAKEKTETPAAAAAVHQTSVVESASALSTETKTTMTTMVSTTGTKTDSTVVDGGIKFTMKRRTRSSMRSSSPSVRFSEPVEAAGPKSKSTSAMQTTSASSCSDASPSDEQASSSGGMKRTKSAMKRSVKWADE